MPKLLNVRVTTMDAVLEFGIDPKASGKQLFDQVTRTLGLREVWYFGLMYTDVKGFTTWLRYDKKVADQGVHKDNTTSFKFRPKFFPEDVDNLIMEVTLHFFYMQVKDDILNEKVYCSPEASVLLASYALQAEYGMYDEQLHPPGFLANQRILPQSVVHQFDLTPDQWEERIMAWWLKYQNMLKSEAEQGYLKIAQDLDMYGINYFEITNKKGTQLWLGVDAFGLNIYNHDNKIAPKISFPWGEIRNVEYHGKKFYIMPEDKDSPDFIFYVPKTKISDHIMQLCVGNHDLYLKRRKVDTMEIQQMRAQAKEEKARKLAERDRYEREKLAREELESEKRELEERVRQLEDEARRAVQAKREADRRVQILEERVKMAEEQTHTLTRKKREAEEEMKRVRASAIKSEEGMKAMKKKYLHAEEQAQSYKMSSQRREQEAGVLRRELERAKDKYIVRDQDQLSLSNGVPSQTSDSPLPLSDPGGMISPHDHISNIDSADELPLATPDYILKNSYYSNTTAMADSLERLSVDDREEDVETESESEGESGEEVRMKRPSSRPSSRERARIVRDLNLSNGTHLHAQVVRQTSFKQTNYDKSKAGSTKSRIAFFEDL